MNKSVYPFIVYEYYIIEAFKPVGGLQRQIKASDCKRKGMEWKNASLLQQAGPEKCFLPK